MNKNNKMPFGKNNYLIMLVGIFILFTGFIIMSLDSEPFGFGFLGLTLGPIIVIFGFITGIISIMQPPKK